MRAPRIAIALFVVLATAHLSIAQETTDAERLYFKAHRSDDRMTQLLGERWYGLVKLQEWTDATGKFHTQAKYVEHDSELKWVKLRAVKEGEEGRVVKDLTIPVEKLDKRGQSRVRQIAFLESKLTESIAAAEAAEEESSQHDGAMSGMDRGDRGRAPMDESPEPEAEPVDRGRRGGRPTPPGPAPPMLMPFNPFGLHAASPAPGGEPSPPAQDADSKAVLAPRLLDDEAWRTSYEAFVSDFVALLDRYDPTQDFAPNARRLRPLAAAREIHKSAAELGREGIRIDVQRQRFDALGDFVWTATVSQPVDAESEEKNDWLAVLGIKPLPFTLKFELDQEHGPGKWRELKVGDQVQFAGRFIGWPNPSELHVAIRFPESQPTPMQFPGSRRRRRMDEPTPDQPMPERRPVERR